MDRNVGDLGLIPDVNEKQISFVGGGLGLGLHMTSWYQIPPVVLVGTF